MLVINKQKIGKDFPPYIIAELSANHGGSIIRAKKTIKKAKDSGASAIKIQTYTPDTMTIKCEKDDFKIVDVNIRRIRNKIEDDPSKPKYIQTIWGYGYCFRKEV